MIKGREILSLPVFTLNDRKQIGEVKDIIYDPLRGIVLGYIVDTGGWIRESKGFLHADLVHQDDDCLQIMDESVIKNVGSLPAIKNALDEKKDIRGLRVESPDGRYIGIIRDLVLNGESGEITGYEISDGVIQDLLDGRSTVPSAGLNIASDKVVTLPEGELDMYLKGEST